MRGIPKAGSSRGSSSGRNGGGNTVAPTETEEVRRPSSDRRGNSAQPLEGTVSGNRARDSVKDSGNGRDAGAGTISGTTEAVASLKATAIQDKAPTGLAGRPSAQGFNLSDLPTTPGMQAAEGGCLEVLASESLKEKIIPLEGMLIFGRAKDCSAYLDDAFVSSHHARLQLGAVGPILEDLGSRNGTFCNDVRVDPDVPVVLKNGDVFSVGNSVFCYKKGVRS